MKVKNSKKLKKPKPKISTGGAVVKDPNKKPHWKKVKLSGNLLSDDGGLGLEGLLGLEVLENPSQSVRVTREKFVKQKKPPPVKVTGMSEHSDDDDGDGSDTERSRSSKNERKKKKKLLKKANEKKAAKMNGIKPNEPGRFVRPLPQKNGNGVTNSNDGKPDTKKKKKGKKTKPSKASDNVKTDEAMLAMDDLIVRLLSIVHSLVWC